MPYVIYIFAISAFALGLAEFLPIGLTAQIAADLGIGAGQTGSIVAAYALGATVAAPLLTALTMNWSRKSAMLTTALVFSLGSFLAAFSDSLAVMTASRFVAGLGHGLFLAVASSTAAQLAGANKAGSAVAVVFGGFTVAMAVGVPVSTWLGGVLPWRWLMAAIGVFGAVGFFGLLFGMKDPLVTLQRVSAKKTLALIFHPALLSAALVTVLAYSGSFASYTYITPLLTDVAGVSASSIGLYMLAYGVAAAVGNILGGKLTDRLGERKANYLLINGIILTSAAIALFASHAAVMLVLVALLGMFTFAVVPSLQARLLSIAGKKAPHAQGVAAGLNIAGFNSGVVLGSFSGGIAAAQTGLASTAVLGVVLSLAGLALLVWQVARARRGEAAVNTI